MAERELNDIEEDEENALREAFERELNLQEVSEWQEESLCTAYQKGLDIIDGKEKSSACNESRNHKWKVGDYCRAIYSEHNEYYEAKIIYMDRDFCTVEFVGYGNEEDSEVKDLIESRGRDARRRQINEANEEEWEGTTDDESVAVDRSYQQHNGNQPATVPSAAAYAPPPPMLDNPPFMPAPRSIPHCSCHPTPPMMPQHPTCHPTPPMMPQYLTSGPTPPMMPQYPSPIASNPMTSSLLTAWYMAGYYAGKFSAGKDNNGCQCCYNHSG